MADYVGNNDYRGYLNSLGQGGDNIAAGLLNYVGNDAVFDPTKINNPTSAPYQAANQLYKAQYATNGLTPGSGSGSGSGSSPGDLAYFDDQSNLLQGLLGQLPGKLDQGLTQLNDSYNQQQTGANTQRSRALQDFETKGVDTNNAKLSALDRVNSGAKSLADSVRQRLGLASGSGSSAYQLAAPNAIAKSTSQNRGGVEDTYGRNFRDLDTAKTRATQDFDTLLQGLSQQRGNKESELRSGILTQDQGIQGQLADLARAKTAAQGGTYDQIRAASAPFQNAYNDRQGQIDNLFNQFRTPFDVKPVTVDNPALQDYVVNKTAISGNNGQNTTPTDSPYATFLKKNLGA